MKVEIVTESGVEVMKITLPVKKEVSKSGKSILVASTGGNKTTSCIVDDKPVVIGVNAYISR